MPYKRKKIRLKKDIVIPAGTEFTLDGVTNINFGPPPVDHIFWHTMAFGRNATGNLYVGEEVGDEGFDEWFEEVPVDKEKLIAYGKHVA